MQQDDDDSADDLDSADEYDEDLFRVCRQGSCSPKQTLSVSDPC